MLSLCAMPAARNARDTHIMTFAYREELETYDAFDEGVFCRSRSWLFISYVVSFASVIAAVWVLLQGYALGDVPSVWPGAAGVLQVRVATPSCCGCLGPVHCIRVAVDGWQEAGHSTRLIWEQVIFILAAALVFFVARTPAEGGGGYDYGSF
jgi:Uncharacterised protein family (UPF0220)